MSVVMIAQLMRSSKEREWVLKLFFIIMEIHFKKIAEFNKDSANYRSVPDKEKVEIISRLRNARLEFAQKNYGVERLIYHCITRKLDGTIDFYETEMDFVEIGNIKNIVSKLNSISFDDGKNEYLFNLTKSTLYKRFYFQDDNDLVARIHVEIISDPYSFLSESISKFRGNTLKQYNNYPFIILPLYSFRNGVGKFVAEKSGLNQWNARGRSRNINEVYIPISKRIHKAFPGFFPPRDESFELSLPNKKHLVAKVCQDGDKALMSNPNKALGEWLLRDVLSLDEGVILTYEMLEKIGVDSVKIIKKKRQRI